jgi:hypothetical protein
VCTLEPMDKVIDEWKQIPILPSNSIQRLIVLDEVELPILLLDEKDQIS